ncbi:hypothetical protein SAMN05444365_101821 [Micromonospora pattaloongensis]|uniref:Uncharacterized protein n=1 Tax=Micromonospora pattaloongensis TaxID=405436 RepID=A0A1H3HFY1_9ACTN|nr:hypothetical protein [Micromonospora pattaloongensis]SDY14382.1 hypothetical protein SAMN05444365_101821 [Micromonospora pattaloongensis]
MTFRDKTGRRLRRALLRATVTLAATVGIILAGSAAKVDVGPAPDDTAAVGGGLR